MEITPQQSFDLVNQYLPEAKEAMRVAYITTGSLFALAGSLLCHVFTCRRAAACFSIAAGVGIGFWTPAGLAPILGSILIAVSILSIWRETKLSNATKHA